MMNELMAESPLFVKKRGFIKWEGREKNGSRHRSIERHKATPEILLFIIGRGRGGGEKREGREWQQTQKHQET